MIELSNNEIKGIHIIADEDFIDIIRLCLKHNNMKCLSIFVKPRAEDIEETKEWMPNKLPKIKCSEKFLIAVLYNQDEVFLKLSSKGYEAQIHWVNMI